MSTLTQRYIEQVVSHLPEGSRPDISRELSALISDMVDERRAADHATRATHTSHTSHAVHAAERSALEELGDPARLAARYRDAPDYLIGPRLYPVFLRSLRWLLPLVLLVALAVNLVVYAATEPEPQLGELIGVVVGRLITVLFTAAGALTLLFALLERTLARPDLDRLSGAGHRSWSVDDLERASPHEAGTRSDAIAGLVFLALVALVPLVPTSFLYVGHLNDGGPFVNPALWDFWLPAYYVLLVLAAAVEAWALASARRTTPQLVGRAAVSVLFAVFLSAAVLTQQVIDPVIPAGALQDQAWVDWLIVVVIWGATGWNLAEIHRRWRDRRSTTAASP